MFQGVDSKERNFREFPYHPSEISAVIVSHSHLDHIGLLPKLYANGFVGKIYSTEPTADFAKIFLQDAQKVQEYNLEIKDKFGLLYSLNDVLGLMEHFGPIEYYKEFTVVDGITAKFHDAGHILGSAIVELNVDNKKIIFSGDLGNPPVPILRDTDFIDNADFVIMESTYGNRLHKPAGQRSQILKSLIKETIDKKGILLIPAFAMERTQEILYELNEIITNNEVPKIPIYLDSPLAIKATRIYPHYERYFDKEAIDKIKSDDNILSFPGLTICKTSQQSKQIRHQIGPKVIIAGSGMSTGGRILFHERDFLSDPTTTLAIVGYQVKGTLGRDLIEGKKQVNILNSKVNVQAKIISIDSYSAHADYNDLINWLSKIKGVKKAILVHGEEEARNNLSQLVRSKLKIETVSPEYGQTIIL